MTVSPASYSPASYSPASYNFTSNIDPSLLGDQRSSHYNPHSYRQYDSGSDQPRSHMGSNYSPDLEAMVLNTSARLLESNSHFIRVQMTSKKRAMEIMRLKEALTALMKENDELKEEIRDMGLELKTLRGTLELFAKSQHENTMGGHGSNIRSGLRTGTWTKKEFRHALAKISNARRGETDGSATSVRKKRMPGRPLAHKGSNDNNDDHVTPHFYLENEDGTPVDEDRIADMSCKAHMLWATLDEEGLAPATFGHITDTAWEYYSRMMLADEAHDFLLLCDDGEWKLWEWSTWSYPSWHRNRNPRSKDGSSKELDAESDGVNTREESPTDSHNAGEQQTAGDNHNNDTGEQTPADGDNDNGSEPEHSMTQGINPLPNPSRYEPLRRQCTPAPARSASMGTNAPLGVGPERSSSDTSNPLPQSGPDPTDSTASSEVNPSNNGTGIENTPTPGTAATVSNPLQIRLTLGCTNNPTPDMTHTATDDVTGHDNNNTGESSPSANNGGSKTNGKGKKQSAESDPLTVSSKKQKKADAMAEPTEGNSIKNICMRQWNATQPRGQGLLCEFESYFKTLLEADKEPFKKELCAAQVAAQRKVKTATKKGTGITNGT
ncbi:hypothetical protein H4582DRAFT_2073494 [Lactarius indigo]|nr:hypothetical protein H4582DRAFT_2073494 [Lactarius indigo]